MGVIQFHSIFFSKKVKKNNLRKSHKGKKHIFSFGFSQNLFDFFLRLRFFFVKNISCLKALKFCFKFFSYVLKKNCII
jgi:hypothetical protein